MQDPDFQKDYQEARRMAVSQAIAQLQQASTQAVATLQAIMQDEEATAASRVSAAKTTLEMSLKAIELENLAQRIEKLEQSLDQQQGQKQRWR